MSSSPDELEVNPFYKFLQVSMRETFEAAQTSCSLVCVPQSQSLVGVAFNLAFTDYHILKPSPYFQGQYLTLHAKRKTVTLENGHLITGEGFPSKEYVKIIGEELCYNKNYKPYKVLIIDRPLDLNVQKTQQVAKELKPELTEIYSFHECCSLLWSYSDLKDVMLRIDEDCDKFSRSYMILGDYLDDASTRLHSICACAFTRSISEHAPLQSDSRLADIIHTAIECYVMGKVHDKVYSVIAKQFANDDSSLTNKLSQLRRVSRSELGIKEQFVCSLDPTISEFSKLHRLQTPYEKLHCVRQTLECMKDDIRRHHQQNEGLGAPSQEKLLFTSDDLIPILVYVLTHSDNTHLHTDLFYIEHFTWSLSSKHEFSFCLATLKASVEYSRRVNIASLHVQYSPLDIQKSDGISSTPHHGDNIKSDLATSPFSTYTQIVWLKKKTGDTAIKFLGSVSQK